MRLNQKWISEAIEVFFKLLVSVKISKFVQKKKNKLLKESSRIFQLSLKSSEEGSAVNPFRKRYLDFFVVPACHELVLDGSVNIFKLFHALSAVD